jgi:hypothetical protein
MLTKTLSIYLTKTIDWLTGYETKILTERSMVRFLVCPVFTPFFTEFFGHKNTFFATTINSIATLH